MAEQPQGGAQNKLGELFVELGSKGAPTLLKQLNSVSASFLLGKNAANQFVQTLTQPVKEAARGAVEIGKMSTSLGTTYKEFVRLQGYLKSHSLSEGLTQDIAKLQQIFLDWRGGIGEIPGSLETGLAQIGHNINEYSGTFESMLQLWQDIQTGTQNFSKDKRNQTLRLLGISSEWGYGFDRADFNLKDYTTISDEEVESLIKTQEAMANLGKELYLLKMHLVEKLSPAVIAISDFISKRAAKGASGEYDEPVKETATKLMIQTALNNPIMKAKILGGAFKSLVIDPIYSSNGKTTGGAAPMTPDMFIDKPTSLNPPAMNDIMPRAMGYEGVLPNLSGITQNIIITNEQRIQGTNAQEIADRIAEINIQDIEYSQYQLSNLAGV